jgi:hypothetical protein
MSDYQPYPMMHWTGQPPAPSGPATPHPYAQPPMGHAPGMGAMPGGMAGMGPAAGGYATGPIHGGIHPAAAGMPGPYARASSSSLFGLGNDRFVKGLLIGAAAAYLLTNEGVQRSAIKGVVKAWSLVQGGIEEAKERFQDAEAEIAAGEAAKRG